MKLRILFMLAVAATAFSATATYIPASAKVSAETASEQAAKDLVSKLGQKAVELLSNKDLDDQSKRDGFNKLISTDFDMPLIGRFVLGKHWRTASSSEKEEYQDLFQKYIVATYQKRIGEYSGENLNILKAKPLNKKEVLVNSEIVRPSGPPIKLDWRVRKSKNGNQKIVDIVVENVSMALTHRDEFSSVINQKNNGVAGLIEKLRQHMAPANS